MHAKMELSQRIEQVILQIRNRLANRLDLAALEAFAARYYSGIAPEDVLAHSLDDLYGAVLSLWRFAEKRAKGQVKVRAFRPSLAQEGWASPHMVIEIVNDDMPFLVDSITMTLARLNLPVHLFLHPVITLRRDETGHRIEGGANGQELRESMMHIEVTDQADRSILEDIQQELVRVLADVRVTVEDWVPMRARLITTAEQLESQPPPLSEGEIGEAVALLRWMADDHFTFLGCRDYRYTRKGGEDAVDLDPASGLGILRDPERRVMVNQEGFRTDHPRVQDFLRRREALIITKANARATVHRPVPLDYVGVRQFDAQGQVIGERRFVGLFTSAAYNRNPRDIPLLRRKVQRVLDRAGLDPRSHDGKALLNLLESYPRDELFQVSEEDLFQITAGILQVQLRPKLRLFVRADEFGRFLSCLVYVPRDRYDSRLRRRFEAILAHSFDGQVSHSASQLGDDLLARIHFIVHVPVEAPQEFDLEQIEQLLRDAMRGWIEDLQEILHETRGEAEGSRLWRKYAQYFPVAYQETYDSRIALSDIDRLERLSKAQPVQLNLYRPLEAAENELRLKIYCLGNPLPLSDGLPMMEHMGLRVEAEQSFRIGDEAQAVHISDFALRAPAGSEFDLTQVKSRFEEAFLEVWSGRMEDDRFNRLVLLAGLTAREVILLRALAKYLRQIGIAFSQAYMEDALCNNPMVVARLVELFHARFDPQLDSDRAALQAGLVEGFQALLDQVAVLDEDRILRRFLNLVCACLRTNFYQRDKTGEPKPQLSLKFDAAQIEELPAPRPYREIFVYSPQVEGVHLRGGKVARGGLRWSDRREDFRTEILGLVKAQMVKNAVIVPVGAKGGFFPKRPPLEAGREAVLKDGIESYQTFVRGLLDITDNRQGGRIVPPVAVVRHDEDDPYLVVAADKGTATFSDIANALSAEYDFWLDDAFASGGSAGYDHKKMGITARGAWELVKRHFREMGKDIMAEAVTVAGVGDMSGDVFGNGMLLSPHIRLLAAFDHRHIFIDPDPDPAISFAERQRLFALARSSWADYESKLISRGGGVFDRKLKAIPLSPEMQTLFGLKRDRLPPHELISAILTLDVDLLWNGGIGTYVKASTESHTDVGDRTNDVVRVDGLALRAKVVGEGGNLGFTQRGRIEYALRGGRINTDAVDNSAGVDCSDHEVNIKILLNAVVAEGDLTLKQRDQLLAEMTEEVATLVLHDNYLQGQALSIMQAQGTALTPAAGRFMRHLQGRGLLDPAIEYLPSRTELETRRRNGQGLTRPELAILLAYAKTTLYNELLDSDLPEDAYFASELPKYFPRPLRRRFQTAISQHRLRREIITTAIANSIVNRVGIDFITEIAADTQRPAAEIARAYAVSREVFELRRLWNDIEGLDNRVATAQQLEMLLASIHLARRGTLWFLRRSEGPISITRILDLYGTKIADLRNQIEGLLPGPQADLFAQTVAKMTEQGVPHGLAVAVARLTPLAAAPDIVDVSMRTGQPIERIGWLYYHLGDRLGLDWLRQAALLTPITDDWQRLAIAALSDDLLDTQRQLVQAVSEAGDDADPARSLEIWQGREASGLQRLQQLITDFRADDVVDAARLAIATRQMRAFLKL